MNKIVEIKFGSHLYGTNTPESDLDFKSIYLPTAREIVLGKYQKTISTGRNKKEHERNNKDDVDRENFSLDRYLQLLADGQTVALDFLFAPLGMAVYASNDIWIISEIFANRFELLNKNVNAFVGYAKQQAAKYGVKGFRVAALRETLEFLNTLDDNAKLNEYSMATEGLVLVAKNDHIKIVECKGPNGEMMPHLEVCNRKVPFHATIKYAKQVYQRIFDEYGLRALKAEKNEGVDWKALSHAVRVNFEAQELLLTGQITFPRPEKDLLLQIKKGELDYEKVAEIIEGGLEDLKLAASKSVLREEPNIQWAEDLIYSVYSDIVKRS